MLADIQQGLAAVFELQVFLFLVAGVVLGAIFGALPGLTATMGVAVLTPLTFWISAEQGLAMLLGIYCAAIPAGGIPAILINVPGTPASIATSWDGYPLSQQGKAGLALGVNALMGAIGQLISILFLAFAAFPIASFALRFGPSEYAGLAIFGISLMAGVSGGRVLKGLLAGLLGLALATVGLDPMTAFPRFSFGRSEFLDGISFIPVMIGLFGLAEVFTQIAEGHDSRSDVDASLGRVLPTGQEWKRMAGPAIGGAGLGTLVGAVPAAGGDIGSVVAWEQARRTARNSEEFGKGALEGLSAAVAAANAAIGGAMTTMLTLGIPGDAVSAILIGALLIHGIQPGPLLFENQRPFVFTIVFLLAAASLLAMLLGLLGARPLARILRIPSPWLWAGITLFGTVGSYALNNAVADVWVMFAAGLAGFLLRRVDVPLGPLVLGLILGPMMEANLRRALILSRGDWFGALSRPITLFFLIATIVSLAWPLLQARRNR
ncbi:MAG: tripartite tricarboxylate transporter permease [Bryobacterales bacterium]